MRKVLSFVLVLSLVLGSFGFAFAAPADVQGTKNEIAVEVLMALDIINGYEDGTYRPDNIVTRAEMAKILIAASGYGDIVNEAKSNFSDMAGHWADKYVAYAASLGLVNGYPDGTFKPNQTVTYAEAATMMVRALGYTDVALAGTWPANYVTKAMVLGLFDKVSTKVGGASRGDIAQMTFALLDEDFGKVDKDNIWVPDASGDTMLKRLGAVLVNDYLVTPGDNTSSKSYIDLTDYVGQVVDLYKESKGDEKFICVTKVESDVIKGEYVLADNVIKGFNGTEYKLTTTSAALSGTAIYVNGVNKAGATLGALAGRAVTVAGTLSGVNFTPATIAGWVPALIQKVDASDLYNVEDVLDGYSDLFGYKVPRTSTKAINYNKMRISGAVTQLADIEKDDLVLVYTDDSTPAEIVKLVVARQVIEGKVTKITSGPARVYIDDVAYKLAPAIDGAKAIGSYKLGETITAYAYTDQLGTQLVDFKVKEVATAGNYAMVVSTSIGNQDYGIPAKIKLLTKSGEIISFPINKTAKFASGAAAEINLTYVDTGDNNTIKVTTGAVAAVAPQTIVRYATNSSGEITKIVAEAYTPSTYNYSSVTNRLNDDALKLASNVVIFRYNSTDVDKSKLVTTADLINNGSTFTVYIAKNGDGEVVAAAVSDLKAADEIYGVVTSFGKVLDSDNIEVFEINMLVNGEAKTYLTDTSVSAVSNSALYLVKLEGGKITSGLGKSVATKSAYQIRTEAAIINDVDRDAKLVDIGGTAYLYNDNTTTVYVASFKTNGSFDKWVKASSINTALRNNAYAVAYDLYNDDDIKGTNPRNVYDTIFVINAADVAKTGFPN